MRNAVVAVLVLQASSVALASPGVVATAEPVRPSSSEFGGQLGLMLGTADVGDTGGFSVGLATALGYRRDDLTVRALFDYYRVGDSSDAMPVRRGRAVRLGGALRYSFANNGRDDKVGVDFWGEAGGGLEHVFWRTGGVLDRPSGELAFGLDVLVRGARDDGGRRRHVGYFIDIRSFVGEGPTVDVPAMCGGPCDHATRPPRVDISTFFELGIAWGH